MGNYISRSRMRRDELDTVMKYAKVANHSIVELGVSKGGTLEGICLSAKPNIPVFGIDNFSELGIIDLQIVFDNLINKFSNLTLIIGDSQRIAKYFNFDIDFLIIDAAHDKIGVNNDTNTWIDKVKLNGIVVYHDNYLAPIKNVIKKALDTKKFILVETVFSATFLRKVEL